MLDRLGERNLPVTGFNGGATADDPEKFVNARAESYWHLRELFEQGEIDLDPRRRRRARRAAVRDQVGRR